MQGKHCRKATKISIHAPPRGATKQRRASAATTTISIHAPPRGATPGGASRHAQANFNSRPSARGDPQGTSERPILDAFQFTPLREGRLRRLVRPLGGFSISIHAPPRGATEALGVTTDYLCDFNSRPSARGDPPRRDTSDRATNFNSRPSARGDQEVLIQAARIEISIHAPPRGATV